MTGAAMHPELGWASAPARSSNAELIRRFLTVATVLSITFPYVQILPLGSYTQPYALVFSILVLLVGRGSAVRQMPWSDLLALGSLALVGVALFAFTAFPYRNVQEYKYLLSYLTPAIVTVACFTLMQWNQRLVAFMVAASAVAWFWLALMQALLDPSFMTFLLGGWSTVATDIAASGRGVIALAPEPAYHAFHMLLLAGCLAFLGRHRWVIVLCFVSAVVLARSASGLLVIGIAIAIAIVVYRPRLALLACVGVAAIFALDLGSVILASSSGNRFLTLIGMVLQNPMSLLEDYSTNSRIGGAAVGLFDTARYLFAPNGMSYDFWSTTRQDLLEEFPLLLNLSTVGVPSGYGVLLFQAGLFAMPFIVLSTRRLLSTTKSLTITAVVLCVPVVFLFQYYFSAPQFGLIYASAIYMWQTRQVRSVADASGPTTQDRLVAAPT